MFDFKSCDMENIPHLWGVHLKRIKLKFQKPVEILGIKFLPGSFYSLFRIPAYKFTGRILPLKSAIGRHAALFDGVFAMGDLWGKRGQYTYFKISILSPFAQVAGKLSLFANSNASFMDDIRFTSVARYSALFTVPAYPYLP